VVVLPPVKANFVLESVVEYLNGDILGRIDLIDMNGHRVALTQRLEVNIVVFGVGGVQAIFPKLEFVPFEQF
jgi:hypothetical protein